MASQSEHQSDIWSEFNFRDNPYRFTALRCVEEDARLFTGRDSEAEEFITQMDTKTGGLVVVSGDIGVGKTSFFNVLQYRMYKSGSGPRLVPCQEVVPIGSADSVPIARSIAYNAVLSIEAECKATGRQLPAKIAEIKSWLSHEPVARLSTVGFSILGTGGQIATPVSVQSPRDASLENWKAVLEILVSECRSALPQKRGIVVCLDNAESLSKEKLNELLIAYRDTLFSIDYVWWVLIGKSGLYTSISRFDQRISQRISGHGVEIPPPSAEEFHALLDRRVKEYRQNPSAVSPLSEAVHSLLFNASKGALRFVLNAGDALVRTIVAGVRTHAKKRLASTSASNETMQEFVLKNALREALIDHRIPDDTALPVLKKYAKKMINAMGLTQRQIELLMMIGDGEISIDDHHRLGFSSGEELTDLLQSLQPFEHGEEILHRRKSKDLVLYSLKGYAALCHHFNTLGEIGHS